MAVPRTGRPFVAANTTRRTRRAAISELRNRSTNEVRRAINTAARRRAATTGSAGIRRGSRGVGGVNVGGGG